MANTTRRDYVLRRSAELRLILRLVATGITEIAKQWHSSDSKFDDNFRAVLLEDLFGGKDAGAITELVNERESLMAEIS